MEQALEFGRQEAPQGDEPPQASQAASESTREASTRLKSSWRLVGGRRRIPGSIAGVFRRPSPLGAAPGYSTGSDGNRYNHLGRGERRSIDDRHPQSTREDMSRG